jgi:hypothetical protein
VKQQHTSTATLITDNQIYVPQAKCTATFRTHCTETTHQQLQGSLKLFHSELILNIGMFSVTVTKVTVHPVASHHGVRSYRSLTKLNNSPQVIEPVFHYMAMPWFAYMQSPTKSTLSEHSYQYVPPIYVPGLPNSLFDFRSKLCAQLSFLLVRLPVLSYFLIWTL